MDKERQHASFLTLALVVAALAGAPDRLLAGGEPLTLRINDTLAEPGDRVAVVLRTYAPRGIGQGQICLVANDQRGAGASPLAALEEVVVFSEAGDAVVVPVFDGPAQMALIELSSASGTINWADGPLAVLYFRLDSALLPGQAFNLVLDLANTFLIDAEGQGIVIEPRAGELTVRAPGASYGLAAEGDAVNTGEVAALGVATAELFAIGSGQVALRWDPAAAAGPPVVSMDQRYGLAFFEADLSEPGRALVTFTSPDGSLNEVPGTFVAVDLPTASGAPSSSPVTLDPDLTHLEDPAGLPLPLTLFADVLEVTFVGTIFTDGFESGGTARWAAVVP